MPELRRLLACLAAALSLLAQAAPSTADAALELRVQHVAEQLRCLVCQNQTIADSHAQLAMDLKKEARNQLAQGRSEQDVVEFMVQRYGDFVLYRPPFKAVTWLLWVGPFALLAAGLLALLYQLRQRGLAEGELATEEFE
ncbi:MULTISPECIES: cytochrome c-type biogenesis protein [unclassified Duganella]|uniref:cytochrome c-type biogenesis protein n=1 Tax=unclassified Duganella TaxID=2636909 RepID=UPI000E34AD8E|nr:MULTISPECIES: cytochrome c-type biogenesis protein [unclassified Duganella]RFP09504.1 cytochrome c-type biogenesis protein CcmH [Duganella sp. BJB475]RFP27624.1 cytochrome c-type biogenesis protein CcmH [Duganella sp. BJB476]